MNTRRNLSLSVSTGSAALFFFLPEGPFVRPMLFRWSGGVPVLVGWLELSASDAEGSDRLECWEVVKRVA
jgi:hypothetical protein